jgi:hypothetical protein
MSVSANRGEKQLPDQPVEDGSCRPDPVGHDRQTERQIPPKAAMRLLGSNPDPAAKGVEQNPGS